MDSLLRRALETGDGKERRRLCQEIAQQRGPRAIEALAKVLRSDRSHAQSIGLVDVLKEHPDRAHLAHVARTWSVDDDGVALQLCLQVLADAPGAGVSDLFVGLAHVLSSAPKSRLARELHRYLAHRPEPPAQAWVGAELRRLAAGEDVWGDWRTICYRLILVAPPRWVYDHLAPYFGAEDEREPGKPASASDREVELARLMVNTPQRPLDPRWFDVLARRYRLVASRPSAWKVEPPCPAHLLESLILRCDVPHRLERLYQLALQACPGRQLAETLWATPELGGARTEALNRHILSAGPVELQQEVVAEMLYDDALVDSALAALEPEVTVAPVLEQALLDRMAIDDDRVVPVLREMASLGVGFAIGSLGGDKEAKAGIEVCIRRGEFPVELIANYSPEQRGTWARQLFDAWMRRGVWAPQETLRRYRQLLAALPLLEDVDLWACQNPPRVPFRFYGADGRENDESDQAEFLVHFATANPPELERWADVYLQYAGRREVCGAWMYVAWNPTPAHDEEGAEAMERLHALTPLVEVVNLSYRHLPAAERSLDAKSMTIQAVPGPCPAVFRPKLSREYFWTAGLDWTTDRQR